VSTPNRSAAAGRTQPASSGATRCAAVVPPAIVWLYGRDVRPLLRARGLHVDSSDADLVGDDLAVAATRVWPLILTRPQAGRVYAVSATRRQTLLFDTVVEWREGLPREPGEIRVKVHEVTGERSICSITDAPADQLECEDWPVAMLIGDHATFLVGLFPDSDFRKIMSGRQNREIAKR